MANEVFDLIVVGGGGSGLAAAIEARGAGCQVLLLEKNAELGGSTAWSVGSITASGTPHQLRRGIRDHADGHYADMPGFAGDLAPRDNDALRRILCDEVPAAFGWLLSMGVRFYGPMPEPPHRLPRMHNVLPNSRSFIHHLERHARRIGVIIRGGQRVDELLRDGERVLGVRCAAQRYLGKAGVVLATGDFTNDPELKHRYLGPREALVEAVNVTATGDGHKLALTLGARILNGDLALGPELRFIPPQHVTLVRRLPPWPALARSMAWALEHMPQALLRPFIMSFLTTALAPSPQLFEQGALLVNAAGRCFCDARVEPALALAEQAGKEAYILLDSALAQRYSAWPHFISTAPGVAYAYVADYRRNRPDVYHEAPSLAALAGKLNMAPDALEQTLAEQRAAGLVGAEGWSRGPYLALGPVRPVFVHNEGGLAVDLEHRVLGPGDRPIAGLRAVGATGQGGLLLKGHGHHLAWAFVSGRRAGRLIAAELRSGMGDR